MSTNIAYNFINVREILSRVLRHPMLQSLTLENAIEMVIDFMYLFPVAELYHEKDSKISIKDFHASLPCDIFSLLSVEETRHHTRLRKMVTTKNTESVLSEPTFKVEGFTLWVSFPKGEVHISYLAFPIDEEGLPMIIDNPYYIRALTSYIKERLFTILFDLGKIDVNVLQKTEQDYCWAAASLSAFLHEPTEAEMENITTILHTMKEDDHMFKDGWKRLGSYRPWKIQY